MVQRDVGLERDWGEREKERDGGRRSVGWRGQGGGRDQAGHGESKDSGGTMTWKRRAGDHRLAWHIWGGTKYPDLCSHSHEPTCMHANTRRCTYTREQRRTRSRETVSTARGAATKRSQLGNGTIITALPRPLRPLWTQKYTVVQIRAEKTLVFLNSKCWPINRHSTDSFQMT